MVYFRVMGEQNNVPAQIPPSPQCQPTAPDIQPAQPLEPTLSEPIKGPNQRHAFRPRRGFSHSPRHPIAKLLLAALDRTWPRLPKQLSLVRVEEIGDRQHKASQADDEGRFSKHGDVPQKRKDFQQFLLSNLLCRAKNAAFRLIGSRESPDLVARVPK